jgi:hypothetical protein
MSSEPRDPARIDRIVARLRAVWHQAPDLRLGQLVVNCTPTGRDPYFVEDDELERQLVELDLRLAHDFTP